jgi:hypothetical protein
MKPSPVADRFLLFSLPRSGSSNLTHALNRHPGIRCCLEPFNTTRTDVPVLPQVEDRKTLDERLDRLWETYNGIKHVFVPAGWPFPKRSTLNRYLLLRPGQRVILLHRRNLLQQIVSNEMARQTQVFHPARSEYRSRIKEFRFLPIEERAVGRALHFWGRKIEGHRRDLEQHGIPFLDLAYEDLFAPTLTLEERRKVLNDVFTFLGRDASAKGVDRVGIDALIDPEKSKINSADTYRLVPGIEAIERRFGSPENGWLFR